MKNLMCYFYIFLISIIFAYSNEIKLKNGDIIDGKIIKQTNSSILVKVAHGTIEINKDNILTEPSNNIKAETSNNKFEISDLHIPLLIKDASKFLKRFFLNNKKECYIFFTIIALIILGFKTGRFSTSFFMVLLLLWFFYFRTSPEDVKDIQKYSLFMHYETSALKELCETEQQFYKFTQFDIFAAQRIKMSFMRILERLDLFERRAINFKAPKIFKNVHNKYISILYKCRKTIGKFIELLGPMKLEEIKVFFDDSQKYFEEEKNVLQEYETIAKENGIVFNQNCNCGKHI